MKTKGNAAALKSRSVHRVDKAQPHLIGWLVQSSYRSLQDSIFVIKNSLPVPGYYGLVSFIAGVC